ncbi:MAG: DUF1080 domain-containing protein [Gemmatimonadales bacterium]|jgi:hypothetical protein|nr:DUF1080 domain-containing protein [Gemmatimonadales bacterium]
MRLPRAPWLCVVPMFLLCSCAGAGTPAVGGEASIAMRAGGWTSLFDGRSTAGWRGYHQATVPAGWTVVDGALTRTGEGGDIITVGEYGSFELELEWQVAPGGNSGVMYRVTEEGEYSYHTGPEMQILDDAAHADGLNRLTAAGACYGLYAGPAGVVKPAGEWNTARIVVRGSQVEHWLNGQRVVSYELGSADWTAKVAASKFAQWPGYGRAARGHIALQDHGDRVAFRHIRLRELP